MHPTRQDKGRDPGPQPDDKPGPDAGGYDERRPGRGDYPGRGKGDSATSQRASEKELEERSRWRDAEPDERSDRWENED